jgi:glutamyl-tRNA synthetase
VSEVKVRFAPSPTGYLHLGGARTALFNWLYAKHVGGKFYLRVEDTDRARSTQEAVDAILSGMSWLGLDFEGEPIYQTQRIARYTEVVDKLLEEDKAYKCYCTVERLDDLRTKQKSAGTKPRYDKHCLRHLPEDPDAKHVVRLKTPEAGAVTFNDAVRGEVTVANSELDDLIIVRSDKTPTYHLSVVVDDFDMGITDVIRGDDHINNTPRQIHIINAIGAPIPRYAHLPMILGKDGKRLSKRHGAVSVLAYEEAGIFPEALRNYLLRLGWSHGDQEIFTLDEMIKYFSLDHINHASAGFDDEKLFWVNQQYLKTMPVDVIAQRLQIILSEREIDVSVGPKLTEVVDLMRDRVRDLNDMADNILYFYAADLEYSETADKFFVVEFKPVFAALLSQLETCSWDKESIHAVIKAVCAELGLKMGKVAQPLRVAVTGGTQSPSVDATCLVIGRDQVVARLQAAIARI